MSSYRIVSSDNHVAEPADLWTTRLEARYRERAPHIVSLEDGDFWFCDDSRFGGLSASGANVGLRFEEPEKLSSKHRVEETRPGGYIPEEHVKDMDIDGIDVSIVYPTIGLFLFRIPDSQLLSALFRTYNDWLAEFCQPFPKRLKGIAMINVDEVEEGVAELERCAKMGLAGGMITVYPMSGKGYYLPEYDQLWAAAQDLGMPLGLHLVTERPGQDSGANIDRGFSRPAALTNADHWIRMSLGDMIFSGVFERFPKLQVGAVEFELSWVPHFLERMDFNYNDRSARNEIYRFKEDMFPSDYFHRNVFVGFQEDTMGVKMRDVIGVDKLLWGSDYPHTESTFPRSREILEDILSDCTDEEKAKIAGGNAARIYNLD